MFERACRSNSSSTERSSDEMGSKIRFAEALTSSSMAVCSAACISSWILFTTADLFADHHTRAGAGEQLVRAVISKLHVYAKIFRFQRGNNLLQRVTIAT